jgi:hypothetical protein
MRVRSGAFWARRRHQVLTAPTGTDREVAPLYHRFSQLPRGFPPDRGAAREAAACSDPTAVSWWKHTKSKFDFGLAFSFVRPGSREPEYVSYHIVYDLFFTCLLVLAFFCLLATRCGVTARGHGHVYVCVD